MARHHIQARKTADPPGQQARPEPDRAGTSPDQQADRVQHVREQRAERGGVLYHVNERFRRVATAIAHAMGSPWAFVLAAASVVIWAAMGKAFEFSEAWQLVINTGTTIITFLMIFLVQNTQNRDSRAIHLKLDELLKGVKGARTGMVDLEDATDEELDELQKQFEQLRKRNGGSDHEPDSPEAPSEKG
jgi:low affinity Fe/Cu permease